MSLIAAARYLASIVRHDKPEGGNAAIESARKSPGKAAEPFPGAWLAFDAEGVAHWGGSREEVERIAKERA